jgi:hypothetical protein
MAEPTDSEESNGKSQDAASGQGEPEETLQGASLPDVSKTVLDVRTLWGKAVSPDASPSSSIKAGGIGAGLEAASKLLPRLRRLSKAKEEKEKPEESDFELIELLGKGGMGMVFLARQKSLDREVAVKVIQPQAAGDAEARGKFFAEALVTGELDHPNIVPVYDFGGTPEGILFYPMKQVRGTSWDKVIQEKSLDDNISVLLSVSDAVAFAHDKGVIHRDLKPENVMLGDYGEVFVMDWGLAASVGMEKAEKLTPETGFAGTPAYMAPEMAKCEPTKIGPASDIYLLGGILYEIVTGLRPHTGDDVYSCIHAAMENLIQPTEKKGELVEIALKAMVTEPQDRYKSVKDFQRAIRDYRSHAESLKLSTAADERLSRAKDKPKTEVYRELTEIIAGYQQAIELWSSNEGAILGLRKARETFVEVALERGDLALAQSQVTAMEEECGKFVLPEKRLESPKDLAEKVSLAIAHAARKEKIARLSRRAAIAASSLVLIVSLTAYFITRAARERTELALGREEKQRHRAEEALRRAERENYYNIIALASARIADSRFDQAESLLWSTPRELRGWEWGRLMQFCHQDLLTLKGHSGYVFSVAFSPDGKRVVTGSEYKTAEIWDAESGQEILTLKGHSMPVVSVAFSPDGKRVVTGSWDKTAKIWDAESGQDILTLKGHSDRVSSVAFSPDGKRVVTGSFDNTAKIWDAESGQEILTLKGHLTFVVSVAFSPDGKRVVTGSYDGTAKIWDAESGQEILTLKGHSGYVFSVAFSPDGKRVVTGSWDNTAKIWDAESGQDILTLKGHSHIVYSVAFSPDGKRVVTGSWDKTAKIWDAESGQDILTLKGHSHIVYSVAFSPDGKRVVTGGYDGTAKIWDAEGGQEILTLKGHSDRVSSVAFSPDGKRVVTGSEDNTAKIWDAESGQEILTLKGHSGPVAFSRDGKRVVTGRVNSTAKIWDAESGQEILTLEGHSSIVTSVAFSPDGKRVVTGSFDKTAKIWDAESGQEILTLKGHSGYVFSVAFSPDGKRVVTGSEDNTAEIWDAESGRELLTLEGDAGSLYSVAWSPDGRRIATASLDSTAKIWDSFDRDLTPEKLDEKRRERYKRWLERNRETAEAKKASTPE